MTDVCMRGRAALSLARWRQVHRLLAALLIFSIGAPALAAEPIVVQLDRTRLIKLPPRTATVVIGDPLIADLSIEPGGRAAITGKGYGSTNVIVLDRDGAVLTEQTIEVKGPGDPIVVVYRGDARNL
jgi:Flp pilus assembly secretin CpaC